MKRAIQKSTDYGVGSPNTVVVRAPAWVGAGLFGITAPLHLFLELNASVAVAAVTRRHHVRQRRLVLLFQAQQPSTFAPGFQIA